ncbi:MAG: GNAT family N-acetyltransferase [Candidatus Parcubacteria bacterium]|nr:GNAT family N-acetyltransferase [Candidatus Parcubacteria bacterium]
MTIENPVQEYKKIQVGNLADFDQEYFESLEGKDGWIALGNDAYKNQRYFTGLSTAGEKIGIVGVYDVGKDQNVLHYVVDQKYRGQGLARELADQIMEKLNLPQVVLTIDLDNKASIRAAEKMPGVEKISNSAYEKDFHKVKYIYRKPDIRL